MAENNDPAHKLPSSSIPRQGVFENVEVGGDVSFRDLLQVLLVPGRDTQEQEYQGVRHNLPQPDYGQFVGREQELTKIFQKLRPYPHSTNSVITIDGIGGIGKSALALEVAHRFLRDYQKLPSEERFDAIVWSSAKRTMLRADRGIVNRRQPCKTLNDICKSIAITLSVEQQVQTRHDESVELICRALTQIRTLLIIDNLETVDDEAVMEFLQDLLPAPTKAIVTTRHRLDVAYPIRLSGMPWDDAEQLINQECQKKGVVLNYEQKDRLHRRTGGVPLAIVWTIAKIGFGYNVRNVFASLGSHKGDIAYFCFEEVVDSIKQRDSYKLLLALAICKEETNREKLMYVAGLDDDELSCDEGLVELDVLSLINKQGNSYTMLPLTKEYINHKLEKEHRFRDEAVRRFSNYNSRKALGFESLIGAATAGLAGLIGNLINEKAHDLLEELDVDIYQSRVFHQAIQKYVRRYADRHGVLKVASARMNNPVKLDEIYTTIQLLPRSALRYYESTESLQELFRESGRRGFNFHDAEKKEGIEVANEQQYLMVLGGPGVGKSTFLRKIGLEALRRHAVLSSAQGSLDALKPQEHYYVHDCIPIMLELRQFSSNNLKIKDIIARELEVCGFPKAQEFTELFLRSGKLLLLLDGLDEVPTDAFNHAIKEIENLVDRYDSNRFIASCRVAAYTFGGFRRFNDVAMAAFDDYQIEQFIHNWFQKPRDIETEAAKRCWGLLSSPDYRAIKELAQTPLLLTLLCVIYDEFQDFLKKRHQVYGEALDVLLRKWAAEKRIMREPIYQQLGLDWELEMLSDLAYASFANDQLFFTKQSVLNHIQEFQNENGVASNINAGKILFEIEVQQGLLVERSRDSYSFSHLTFQEYLAAKYVIDTQSTEHLIESHLTDKQWREIFLLVAGLIPGKKGADNFLLSMENKSRKMLNSSNIKKLFDWIDSVLDISNDVPLFDKRLTAFYLATFLGVSPAYAQILTQRLARLSAKDLELSKAIGLSLIPDSTLVQLLEGKVVCKSIDYLDLKKKVEELDPRTQSNSEFSSKSWNEKIEEIKNVFIQAFRFPCEYTSFSKEEQFELESYVYAYELIFACKESATRVSPKIWEEIEARFLLNS